MGMIGGVASDVVRARKVGFAFGVQPGNPAPAQRVGGRIAVNQMAQEEVCAQFPIEPQGEDPDARKPHARVVVQIAGFHQFTGPMIERLDPGAPFDRFVKGGPQPGVGIKPRKGRVARFAIAAPHAGALFQIAFEVDAPEHLGDELLGRGRAVLAKNRVDHFGFVEQAGVQPRRQLRDVGARTAISGPTVIVVASVRISASSAREKFGEARQTGVARRGEKHGVSMTKAATGSPLARASNRFATIWPNL